MDNVMSVKMSVKQFDGIDKVIDEIIKKRNIVLDFTETVPDEKEKCKNFLSGLIYALEGKEEILDEQLRTVTLSDSRWIISTDCIETEEITHVVKTVEEKGKILAELSEGHSIILDLSEIETPKGRIVFDYVTGGLYGLFGQIDKPDEEKPIYKLMPSQAIIKGKLKEEYELVHKNHETIKAALKADENIEGETLNKVKELCETNIYLLEKNRIYSPEAIVYGGWFLDRNMYDEAINILERFYRFSKEIERTKHGYYIDAINLIGIAYKAKGDKGELEQLYHKLIEDGEKDKNYDILPMLYNSLSHFYISNRESRKGIEVLKKCVRMFKNINYADRQMIVTTFNNMAVAYKNIGRFKKSLSIIDETVDTYGNETEAFDTILSMKRIKGEIYYSSLGKLKKSLQIYEDILSGYKTDMEKNRLLYATACGTMGSIYDDLNDSQMAEKMYLEAIKSYQEKEITYELGVFHNNLGALYSSQNKTDEAKMEFVAALEIYNALEKNDVLNLEHAESILTTQEHIVELAKKVEKENGKKV